MRLAYADPPYLGLAQGRMRGEEMGTTRDAATEAVDLRDSLAQEIRDTLKVRGLWAPARPSDLIGAVALALDDSASTIATLRKALERYGRHLPDCDTRYCVCEIDGGYHSSIPPLPDHAYESGKCDCGLSAALDEKEG